MVDHERDMEMAMIAVMRSSEIDEPQELLGFIPQIFDTESKLKRDDFIRKIMSKECNWIFDPKKITDKFSIF